MKKKLICSLLALSLTFNTSTTIEGFTNIVHAQDNSTYTYTVDLFNITASNNDSVTNSVTKNSDLSMKLTPTDEYYLPASLSVTMNGELLKSADYTYNCISGALSIPNVTGNVFIYGNAQTLPSTSAPIIVGTPNVGETLSIKVLDRGTEVDFEHFTVKWYADGYRISGSADSTLELTHSLLGKNITVSVAAPSGNEYYNSTENFSNPTAIVQAFYNITFRGNNINKPVTTIGNATLNTLFETPDDYQDGDVNYTFADWYDSEYFHNKINALTVFKGHTDVYAKLIQVQDYGNYHVSSQQINVSVPGELAIDVSDITNKVTEINVTGGVENFVILGLDKLVKNLSYGESIKVTVPTYTNPYTPMTWTIPAGTDVVSRINFGVTIHEASETDNEMFNGGALTFAHNGDLVNSGSGIILNFPTLETINSNDSISLTKICYTSEVISGSFVSAKEISSTFTNCSTWGIGLNTETINNTTINNSTNNSTSSNATTNTISTVSALGYVPQLNNVSIGDVINLNSIDDNGMGIVGWYYDIELTNPVRNSSLVVTQSVLDNGVYPIFAVTSNTSTSTNVNTSYNTNTNTDTNVNNFYDTDTNYIPTAVPSTIAKVLAKLF